MESKAILKFAHVSPRKARRIVDTVRGKQVEQAIVVLKSYPHAAARTIEKVLKSAVANAEHENVRNPEEMFIKLALIDPGPVMKRIMPRAQGRMNRILKRTSHITLVLSED
ncbi:MAG: 50S ribosomal protein L22 [Nitrospirae bacterium]|nr:50S ribosomal protein L22 [Nitrospirota bacterium]